MKDHSPDTKASEAGRHASAPLPDPVTEYAVAFEASLKAICTDISDTERMIAQVSAACTDGNWPALRSEAEQALEHGVSGEALVEICLQISIYTGVVSLRDSVREVMQVSEEKGFSVILPPLTDTESAAETADRVRRELHGVRHDHDHANPDDPVLGPLYELTSRLGYGRIWNRPGLSTRHRFICALVALTITGSEGVLGKFVRSAHDHGFSVDQIRQIISLAALYIGTPRTLRALSALRTASEMAAE